MLRTLSHLELVNGCFFTSNILHVGQVETAHFCYRCSKLFLTFLKATDVGFCSHSGIQDLNFWHLLFLQVAQEINSEAKFQNDFLNQLQMTLAKAQAGVKNNMRRLNKSIIQQGSNHVLHVVLFALFCFMVVYLLSKFSRR